MKKTWMILIPVLTLVLAARAENGGPSVGSAAPPVQVDVDNQMASNQGQNQSASASGGDSQSDSTSRSNSTANVSLSTNTTSISNNQVRTPPLTTFPPYLPYWNHGGWGTIKAYFPNGPTANDQVYETTFDPQNRSDMHEIRSVLKAMPHRGVLEAVGGVLNSVAVGLFGKPDTYFHGRGMDIADSIIRDRRPEHKPLLVFIDSNVDMNLLGEEGYAYAGKISIEADPDRNWDQAYKVAVAEALLWDVDILLVAGGMKGVTTGSNITFPSAAAAYSQATYSLSLLGSKAKGITEGKGKAMLSAEAYRYNPQALERRRIPAALYDRIRLRACPAAALEPPAVPARSEIVEPSRPEAAPPAEILTAPTQREEETLGPGFGSGMGSAAPSPKIATGEPAYARSAPAHSWAPTSAAARRAAPKHAPYSGPGVTMSQELFDMAGFKNDQEVGYVEIRP